MIDGMLLFAIFGELEGFCNTKRITVFAAVILLKTMKHAGRIGDQNGNSSNITKMDKSTGKRKGCLWAE